MTFKFLKIVLTTCRYAVMLSVGALSISGTASATLIDSIAALNDGDQYRVLFVTSTTRDATSSDISVYNSFVNDAAQAGTVTGGLGLTWTAIASAPSINARQNTGVDNDVNPVTFFNADGDVVASSGSDLWDGVLNGILAFDESGLLRVGEVWTGTFSTGLSVGESVLGSRSNIRALYGSNGLVNMRWIEDMHDSWTVDKYLFGMSEQASFVAVQVPSPGTAILLSLGLAGLTYSRYRKQS
jgi:hypothetical protein